jgi:aspartate oxidase
MTFTNPGSCKACHVMFQRLAEKCKTAAQRRAKPVVGASNHSKLKGQRHDLSNSPTELRQIIQSRSDIQRNTLKTLRRQTKKLDATKKNKEEAERGDGEEASPVMTKRNPNTSRQEYVSKKFAPI